MITVKCMAVACNKLRYKRYMMKELPAELVEHVRSNLTLTKTDEEEELMKILKSSMALLPQLPTQNFIPCYGLLPLNKTYFTITDLVQDNHFLPSQQAEMHVKFKSKK
jgi:hypothetical protein